MAAMILSWPPQFGKLVIQAGGADVFLGVTSVNI